MKNFIICIGIILLASCRHSCTPEEAPEQNPTDSKDSTTVTLGLSIPEGSPVIKTDLFVYGSQGARELESHLEMDGALPSELDVRTTAGDKIFVAICNFPFKFNLQSLGKMDSMELLAASFADDSPENPIMSGTRTSAGEITLSPLLCKVTLSSVSNALDGYVLLENPRVWLSGLNPEAEILRQEEFRPTDELEETGQTKLPYDIGFYTQNPGTVLWCYPNDTPENILGTVRTEFNFECEIEGQTCLFTKTLPPMGRAAELSVELTVFSESECLWEVH